MPRLSAREVALLCAPLLILGGVGFLLQNRQGAFFRFDAPFETYVQSVRKLPVSPRDVSEGFDTKIEVEIEARGQQLKQWQERDVTTSSQPRLVTKKDGSARRERELDRADGEWRESGLVLSYRLNLRDVPAKAGGLWLRDHVKIGDGRGQFFGSGAWLETPVRKAGEVVKLPPVSRDPGIELRRFEVSDGGQARNYVQGAIAAPIFNMRLRLVFHTTGPSQGKVPSVPVEIQVCDQSGRCETGGGTTSYSFLSYGDFIGSSKPQEEKAKGRERFVQCEFDLMPTDFARLKGALRIRGKAWWDNRWPLAIDIPLRDKSGKMLWTPLPPAPFTVVSQKVRGATASEKAEFSADTVAVFRFKSRDPKQRAIRWNWSGSFDQHLRDAKAAKIWQMKFKGGAACAPPIFNALPNGQMELTYPLVLAPIPAKRGALTLHASVSANETARVPIQIVVRPK